MSERRTCDRCGKSVPVAAITLESHRDESGAPCLRKTPTDAKDGLLFWRFVRGARERRGISSYHLAALAGVTQPAIARIEGGRSGMKEDTLIKLAAAMGLTLRELLIEGLAAEG